MSWRDRSGGPDEPTAERRPPPAALEQTLDPSTAAELADTHLSAPSDLEQTQAPTADLALARTQHAAPDLEETRAADLEPSRPHRPASNAGLARTQPPLTLEETRASASAPPLESTHLRTHELPWSSGEGHLGDDDDARPPPPRIGRFVVLRRLGRGGMGVVYAAYDDSLDRKIAVKLLRDRNHDGGDRLLREAQALARLSHPNVVAVYEVGRALDSIYIAMEFVVGVTLGEWLAARRRTQAEILDVFLQAGRGLAAAHAVGMIHRDFKPDNVMVGDDGRVRVFDFGLARSVHEAAAPKPDLAARSSSGSFLDTDMTMAGSILGTPAYMAPEQFLARPTDARTDIFAFCVALHLALHGERPFHGATFDQLRDAVCRGAFAPPPRDPAVPAWLRARVLRGLQPDPAERWQTLGDLLAALTDDPLARRRRWLRTAGWIAALTTVVVGLVLGLGALRTRLAERAREEAAARRWASISGRVLAVDATTPAAARAEADGLFHAFVTAVEVRGTRALTEAWLARGRRIYEQGDGDRAMEAFAAAYTGAPTAALERDTLLAIAGIFRARWDIAALTPLVRFLDDGRGASDPTVDALRLDVALDHRDFAGATDLLERLGPHAPAHLRGLQPALRRLGRVVDLGPDDRDYYVVDVDGDGEHELLEAPRSPGLPRRPGELRLRDLDGGPARTLLALDQFAAVRPVPGSNLAFVEFPATDEWALHELTRERTIERWRGRFEAGVMTAWADDLDGDGALEVYAALSAYRRGLFRVDPARGDEPSRAPAQIVDPTVDRLRSDGLALTGDDLDGDGRRELILGLGPWRGYHLRLLRWTAGAYETVDRAEIGAVLAAVTLRAADGGRLLAAASSLAANAVLFPTPPHLASPPGLHLFRLRDDHLERGATLRHIFGGLGAGDVDGDGLDDLVYASLVEDVVRLFLVRQGRDGAFTPIALGHGELLAVAQADDDPELELVVRDGGRLWLFGHGSQDMSIRPDEQAPAQPPPPELADPALLAHWQRADRLAILGLDALAARSLLDLAELLEGAPAQRSYVLDRAAALFAHAGDRARAIEVLGDLAADPARAADAARLAAGHHAALGDFFAADAALPPDRDGDAGDALAPFTAAELRRLADPARRTRVTFDHALDPAWILSSPAAVRRDPVAGRLTVSASDAHGPWATLPVTWDGGPILIRVELDITALEYGSSFWLRLVAGDEPACHATLGTLGGAGQLLRFLTVQGGLPADVGTVPAETPAHLSLTFAIAPETARVAVVAKIGDLFHRQDVPLLRPLDREALRLEFGPQHSPQVLGQFRGALAEVELVGLRPRATTDDPYTRGVAALVDGRPEDAVALLRGAAAEHAATRSALALALAETGRFAEARETLAPLVDTTDVPTLRDLGEYLRSHEKMRPVLAELFGARFPVVQLTALAILALQHRSEPFAQRLALTELAQLRDFEPDKPLTFTMIQVLLSRAGILHDLGELDQADLDLAAARRLLDSDLDEDTTLLHVRLDREVAKILLARGDRVGARAALERSLAQDVDPTLERARVARDRVLGALLADP